MEQKKQMKISLKIAIIIVIIIVLLISIIGISIYIKATRDNYNTSESMVNKMPEKDQTENETIYEEEIDGYCRIKGTDSNLLYKNDYESDTSYLEKVIFLDEEAKSNMTGSNNVIDANEVLYRGEFSGEFIRIKYDSNSDLYEYKMSLAYMEQINFKNCKTNNIVMKAFDKKGNETTVPKNDYSRDDDDVTSNISNVYALFDITTEEGEDYIVGLYDAIFSEDNPNVLVITVVLKKQNVNIDIKDEKQVQSFWEKYANYKVEENTGNNEKNYEEVSINGKTYYHLLNNKAWDGEYYSHIYNTSAANAKQEVVSYEDYKEYIDEVNSDVTKDEIEKYYTDKKSNYIILNLANTNSCCDLELIDCVEEDNKIIIYGVENLQGFTADSKGYFIAIPTSMPVGTNVQYRECLSSSEISNLKNYGTTETEMPYVDKPIIYLYPTEETKTSVKLLKSENLICSYPKYKDEWNVLARPDGILKDLSTNRQLYSLYYESKNLVDFKVTNEGFLVKGEDTIEFLEEKLAVLGLTEREAEEFIVYWLPKLEANKYNYIRFATSDEINENMPLEINPNPDTIIRVLMLFKGLDNPINVKEQQLITPERKGFVVVEWGGGELN